MAEGNASSNSGGTVELTATPRTYALLKQNIDPNGGGESWIRQSNVEADSARAAIQQAAGDAGTYVAVPVRSFVPVEVTLETKTVVKLG